MIENELSGIVIGKSIHLHKNPGPGLLESAYEKCLVYDLVRTGMEIEIQQPIPLIYKGNHLECGYRCDIIVEKKLIVEVKSVEMLSEIHSAQMLTYLKMTGLKLGLVINFNVVKLIDGVRRLVNNL